MAPADPQLEYLERCVRIAQGLQESAGFEHVLILLIRKEEAAAVHILQDRSAWWGSTHRRDEIDGLAGLARSVRSPAEEDVTASAVAFDPSLSHTSAKTLLSGVLWSLAEPVDCEAAVLLARDVGDAPAWLAARYEPTRVQFTETPADAFNRELVRLHEFADESFEGDEIPKPSLRAAEAGAAYELDLSSEATEVFEQQMEAFVEKFGREPGPTDPIFFDPESDTPQPLSPEKIADLEAQLAEHGFDQEWFLRNQAKLEESGQLHREGRGLGRNDPCWCGSGKKFKRCHGA
jgi:hypothetical protein